MVKHTQINPRQFANKLYECVWPFCGIGAKRDKEKVALTVALTATVKCIYLKHHIFAKGKQKKHLQSFIF